MCRETTWNQWIFYNHLYGLSHGIDQSSVIDHTERTGKHMKTVEEIIAFMELEMAEAYDAHDLAQDKQERLLHLIKATTIEYLLTEIR